MTLQLRQKQIKINVTCTHVSHCQYFSVTAHSFCTFAVKQPLPHCIPLCPPFKICKTNWTLSFCSSCFVATSLMWTLLLSLFTAKSTAWGWGGVGGGGFFLFSNKFKSLGKIIWVLSPKLLNILPWTDGHCMYLASGPLNLVKSKQTEILDSLLMFVSSPSRPKCQICLTVDSMQNSMNTSSAYVAVAADQPEHHCFVQSQSHWGCCWIMNNGSWTNSFSTLLSYKSCKPSQQYTPWCEIHEEELGLQWTWLNSLSLITCDINPWIASIVVLHLKAQNRIFKNKHNFRENTSIKFIFEVMTMHHLSPANTCHIYRSRPGEQSPILSIAEQFLRKIHVDATTTTTSKSPPPPRFSSSAKNPTNTESQVKAVEKWTAQKPTITKHAGSTYWLKQQFKAKEYGYSQLQKA